MVVGEPASLAEGKLFYAKSLKAAFFTAKSMTSTSAASDAGTDITTTFTGTVKEPGEAARDDTLTTGDTVEDEATMIAKGKAAMGNPERYAWRVEKKHAATGGTTYTAIGERVMAYLHHGSLDPSAHDRYRKSESDSTFYAASTFAPPPPPSASPAAPATP